MKKSQLTLTKR